MSEVPVRSEVLACKALAEFTGNAVAVAARVAGTGRADVVSRDARSRSGS